MRSESNQFADDNMEKGQEQAELELVDLAEGATESGGSLMSPKSSIASPTSSIVSKWRANIPSKATPTPLQVFTGDFQGKAKELRELKPRRALYNGICAVTGVAEALFFVALVGVLVYINIREHQSAKGPRKTHHYPLWLTLVAHIPLALVWVFMLHRLILTLSYFVYVWMPDRPGNPKVLPMVTIQLPMYNERAVFERCITNAARVKWPRDKLQIMIIDDSDESDIMSAVDGVCRRLRNEGHNILVHRRPDRVGYKGGALAHAMKYAQGEFVAIFDTDFVITPDFLERTVPHFYDEKGSKNSVGLVQCPWTWLNDQDNILTRAQAIWLDFHFMFEQMVRSRSVKVFGFNGTAGIWRAQAIVESGGWTWDSVTEDADLGYRAFMRGYTFRFLPDLPQACELPNNLSAFRSQQYRWIKGFPQIINRMWLPIVRSNISLRAKIEIFFHLGGGITFPLSVVVFLTAPVLLYFELLSEKYIYVYLGPTFIAGLGYLITAFEVPRVQFHASLAECLKQTVLRFFPIIALFEVFIGLSAHLTAAHFEGWFSKDATFHSTPKDGSVAKAIPNIPNHLEKEGDEESVASIETTVKKDWKKSTLFKRSYWVDVSVLTYFVGCFVFLYFSINYRVVWMLPMIIGFTWVLDPFWRDVWELFVGFRCQSPQN